MKKIFLIGFLLYFYLYNAYAQSITNLVFEGAGIRGIAYSGAIKKLEEHKLMDSIEKVGGTSAGAITALMIAIGYNSEEIYSIISTTKFQKFNDGQYAFIGGFSRMKKRYGWYRGNEFTKWLEKLIEAKTGNSEITFRQLEDKGYKSLFVTATCINKQKLIVFSKQTYPDMKVKDAVRISMSVPLYFEAVFIDSAGAIHPKPKKNETLDIMVDGGIIGNFPIFIFDSIITDSNGRQIRIANPATLGIRIDSDSQIQQDSIHAGLAEIPIENINDFVQAFYVLVLENLNRTPLIPEDWERTISVSSVGIGPKIKRLSESQKQALIQSGERFTEDFFKARTKNQPKRQ